MAPGLVAKSADRRSVTNSTSPSSSSSTRIKQHRPAPLTVKSPRPPPPPPPPAAAAVSPTFPSTSSASSPSYLRPTKTTIAKKNEEVFAYTDPKEAEAARAVRAAAARKAGAAREVRDGRVRRGEEGEDDDAEEEEEGYDDAVAEGKQQQKQQKHVDFSSKAGVAASAAQVSHLTPAQAENNWIEEIIVAEVDVPVRCVPHVVQKKAREVVATDGNIEEEVTELWDGDDHVGLTGLKPGEVVVDKAVASTARDALGESTDWSNIHVGVALMQTAPSSTSAVVDEEELPDDGDDASVSACNREWVEDIEEIPEIRDDALAS